MEIRKIRCKICNFLKEGLILEHYNLKVCLNCFPDFFRKRVDETIKKFKMFTKLDKILIALSGGKDSMSLAKALKDLGYSVKALHINMEIKDLSNETSLIVKNFCEKENLELKIVNLNDYFTTNLEELSKIAKKPICSVCGSIRRYIMNREAFSRVIVTGHTINDEVSFLLKNLIFWNDDLLCRINPILAEREGLSRKAKPLCLISEEETRSFCEILGIKYVDTPCPYKSKVYDVFKGITLKLNERFPGSLIGFYKGYLKRIRNFYPEKQDNSVLQKCKNCGYLTTAQVCSICRLKEKLLE